MDDLIGGAWIAETFRLGLALPLATVSSIGTRRATHVAENDRRQETYVEAMRPQPNLRGHLTFHLKHEPPNLELLSRLFATCEPGQLIDWFRDEPTGQYARRACFLYEWLTGNHLDIEGATQGGYVDAIRQDMREESRYIRSHARARAAIKDVIEMPDAQVDRVIRSIESNNGELSNVLAREIPHLTADGVWEEILDAMKRAFQDEPTTDAVSRYRQRN
jgi:hypothetical protein